MTMLFEPYRLAHTHKLQNHILMAPMKRTRTSAEGDVPTPLMAKYYTQRASAGLIVTEATDVSKRSKGYAWTPGIHTDAQVQGWRQVTDAVHQNGGTIFLQVWHVGRMAHISLMPGGEAPWGVTDEKSASDVFARGADGQLSFVPA